MYLSIINSINEEIMKQDDGQRRVQVKVLIPSKISSKMLDVITDEYKKAWSNMEIVTSNEKGMIYLNIILDR